MAEADIFIDADRSQVVTSETDTTIKALPRFVQGDTITLRIHLLRGYTKGINANNPYDEIPTDGLTLQVALREGTFTGSGDFGDIVAAQYTWTPEEDLYFEGAFSLATEEVNTLLASVKTFDATFVVQFFEDSVPTTVLQQAVKVYRNLIDQESTLPVPTPTYLTAEAALATFVELMDETDAIYLKNATSGVRCKLWIDTDGTFHADPVT